ncbi:hypothetical protein [Moritella viscosa]|uniref:hypothetical protein n=1 Tax=Moritella viscosa TaxID=80854 RepID=UPI00091F536A|nr:hypothetical protein [Moritella viscosa]SHO16069.1 Histidine kinase [Moritella viscosa]SHO18804.1 Histidine kinase [Moritella viscosa]
MNSILYKLKHEELCADKNTDIAISRAGEVIKELANVVKLSGITGDILLVTLHDELNDLSVDFITQNDLDIDLYSRIMTENILYPAKKIFDSDKSEDCGLRVLAKEPDSDKYCSLLTNGHVSSKHLDAIRTCFFYSSRLNNALLSNDEKIKLSEINPDPMLIWLLIGVVYFALHSFILNERKCNVN